MHVRLLVVACICLVLAGCGRSLSSAVTGKVTLDGAPLTSGDVTFAPVGEGQIAYGKIDGAGSYSLSTGNEAGIEAGEYHVMVIATGAPPSNDQPPPLLTPAKYSDKTTSPLKHVVKPGSNTINLDLLTR